MWCASCVLECLAKVFPLKMSDAIQDNKNERKKPLCPNGDPIHQLSEYPADNRITFQADTRYVLENESSLYYDPVYVLPPCVIDYTIPEMSGDFSLKC